MTRLGESVARATELLTQDLSSDKTVERLLEETGSRRSIDLADLSPTEQAELIASRTVEILPGVAELAKRIEERRGAGRGLAIKLGIDPTAADVHLGHVVPMIILSRFQRMGHDVTLLIGDFTAKIGDPSGRTAERPPLTDEDIARNLAGYQDQVRPFFDFEKVSFRQNSEWLAPYTFPELLGLLSQVPVSQLLQREDFRNRLAAGSGLTMSELLYPIAQALDSVALECDVELGGADQLLNLQMGRKLMELRGQRPQLVVTMPLIEGTDGTGAKMSKSKGNYVALSATADDVFGKIMSIPDRLMKPYLEAWTEWTDAEIAAATARVEDRSLHPMDLKKVLAGEVVAALYGVEKAMAARAGFVAQFSKKSFTDVETLPVVDAGEHGAESIATVLSKVLEFQPSASAARRVAKQNGLRLVIETEGGQESVVLPEAQAVRPLAEVVAETLEAAGVTAGSGTVYLKAGRKIAQVSGV
ncbi:MULTISPECIES: tyrosine--tRNA ligase [Streptomyces]|uniref:tyrosine--tRNA ligase n=1 Tax=Streptomyces TaxID=1883 RepID=UPI000F776104|nr:MULTISPECIES: tyrosine--tRNA ligase [unclassified Streptomyces]AJZ85126.1 tyrosine--tRNA ligase [Streptomyces sp. AgN23]RSS40737.1 tyrosine--tRNA ligase [Streptomyces sp. WAC05858]WTA80867.1 tyrosine--tRNA ligase [Streptomyces antimycoticus]